MIANGQLDVAISRTDDQIKVPLLNLEPLATFPRVDPHQPTLAQWSILPSLKGVENLLTPWCRERLLRPGLSRPLVCTGSAAEYVRMDEHVEALGKMVRDPEDVSQVVLETQLALVGRFSFKTRPPLLDVAIKLAKQHLAKS